MKKIFTLFFAAVLCIGSSWGATYEIGTGGTISNSGNLPITLQSTWNSISQQLYLASDLTTAGANAGNITAISFYFNSNPSPAATTERTLEVWIDAVTKTSLSTSSGTSVWFYENTSKAAGTKYFDGPVTIPASANWYTITLDNKFGWDGIKNLIITINDKSDARAATDTRNHKVFSVSAYRSNYKTGVSGSSFNAANTHDISGTVSQTVPVIRFTFEGDDPEPPTPSLTASSDITNFGTFAKEYETKTATITVTGENLTEDVIISAATGLSVTPTSLTKEAVMAEGGAIVTVSTTSSFVTEKKVTISGNSIQKEIKFTGEEAQFVDKNSYTFLYNTELGSYSSLAGPTSIASVNASAQTFVLGTASQACTIDYSGVPGSYVALGKVSNLKVKKTGEGLFKAFAFDYSGPVVTVITIEEDADNSETLAEKAENVNVTLNRAAFQKNMFNTFCVPFDINEGLIGTRFADCDIITLASSAYNDGVISLTFEGCTQMEAGQPYLINPKNQDISFTFNGCDIQNVASGSVETDLVDFIGIVNPTKLPHSKEILFMGLNNELFWPTEAGTLNGMRCYFKVNFEGTPEGSAIAGAPVRMSIIKSNGITTDLPMMWSEPNSPIIMYKNQLFIIKDNKLINISGQTIQ